MRGRRLRLGILRHLHTLGGYGVRVLSHREPWSEAPGELAETLCAIAGWVARTESQRRSERTKAGLARVVAQGKRLGRPPGARDRRKRKKGPPGCRYGSCYLPGRPENRAFFQISPISQGLDKTYRRVLYFQVCQR